MKENYFNNNIIGKHDDIMFLNNMMAETYDFCIYVAERFGNESDREWNYQQKRFYLCYDV